MITLTPDEFNDYRKVLKYNKKITGEALTQGLTPLGWGHNTPQSVIDLFLNLAKPKEIEIRIDPLFGKYTLHTTLISGERAERPIVIKQREDTAVDTSCNFCKPRIHSGTPEPKIIHTNQIISIPNLFPYINPHYVTVFSEEHKSNLEDLTEDDIKANLSTGVELAHMIQKENYDGMWDFINWGALAGASQQHPHSQRGALYKFIRDRINKEADALKLRKKELNKDPFEVYMELARKGSLLIHENEDIFIFAPFVPMFTDQVDILTKRKNDKIVSNYLELDNRMIDSISRGMINVLKGLENKRGVRDLNILTHQARFRGSEDYRMHWHICPRKNLFAGMEFDDIFIVSAYPEDTAKALAFEDKTTEALAFEDKNK